MSLIKSQDHTLRPYPAKIYFLLSAAALGLIALTIQWAGETNLPPLIPFVRHSILALYLNLMLAYGLWMRDARWNSEKPSGLIWMIPVALGLSLMMPVFSGDLMEYLIRGRMLGIYHQSPYIALPRDFPDDPLRPFSIWINNPDSYGPLSVYLQTPPAVLFSGSVTGAVWAYKVMAAAFCAVGAFFLHRIVREHLPAALQGRWAALAYSPLLIVAVLIDGHNDAIMMAFSIISVHYLLRKDHTPAFLFWTAGFLVKYMNAIQLPLMVLIAVRDRWKRDGRFPVKFIVVQAALNTALIAAAFWPIWGGEGTFLAILRAAPLFYTNTFPYAVQQGLALIGVSAPDAILKVLFWSAYAVLYAFCIRAVWRGGAMELFRSSALAYVGFYLAMSTPFGYWYLLWALPWVILADWPFWRLTVMLYSWLGLLAFYKRINYLTVLAFGIYAFAWAIRRFLPAQERPPK